MSHSIPFCTFLFLSHTVPIPFPSLSHPFSILFHPIPILFPSHPFTIPFPFYDFSIPWHPTHAIPCHSNLFSNKYRSWVSLRMIPMAASGNFNGSLVVSISKASTIQSGVSIRSSRFIIVGGSEVPLQVELMIYIIIIWHLDYEMRVFGILFEQAASLNHLLPVQI